MSSKPYLQIKVYFTLNLKILILRLEAHVDSYTEKRFTGLLCSQHIPPLNVAEISLLLKLVAFEGAGC